MRWMRGETMSVVYEIQSATGILKDWLGEGGVPVDRRIAEHRAEICRQCPQNRHGKWWETAKHSIAEVVRSHIEVKNHMKIGVSDESRLEMCNICGCSLPLKIHVPLKHIFEHTKPEMLARFPQNCWIPNESKATP